MTLTRDGRFAYVPMRGEDSVAIVQLDPLTAGEEDPDEPRARTTPIRSADGSRIYVGAQYGNAVAVFDPATQDAAAPDSDRRRRAPIAITDDGRTIYAALSRL